MQAWAGAGGAVEGDGRGRATWPQALRGAAHALDAAASAADPAPWLVALEGVTADEAAAALLRAAPPEGAGARGDEARARVEDALAVVDAWSALGGRLRLALDLRPAAAGVHAGGVARLPWLVVEGGPGRLEVVRVAAAPSWRGRGAAGAAAPGAGSGPRWLDVAAWTPPDPSPVAGPPGTGPARVGARRWVRGAGDLLDGAAGARPDGPRPGPLPRTVPGEVAGGEALRAGLALAGWLAALLLAATEGPALLAPTPAPASAPPAWRAGPWATPAAAVAAVASGAPGDLARAAVDRSPVDRANALAAGEALLDAPARARLARDLAGDPDPLVRRAALAVLGRAGASGASALLDLADAPDRAPGLRAQALREAAAAAPGRAARRASAAALREQAEAVAPVLARARVEVLAEAPLSPASPAVESAPGPAHGARDAAPAGDGVDAALRLALASADPDVAARAAWGLARRGARDPALRERVTRLLAATLDPGTLGANAPPDLPARQALLAAAWARLDPPPVLRQGVRAHPGLGPAARVALGPGP